MSQTSFKYSNKDITVIWQPGLCQHSKLCWTELVEVFNPKERPWIKMDGSTTEKIIDQVKKCPSGALTYVENSG
jgi:uncharacterized Fe-S cluster protein YjdI